MQKKNLLTSAEFDITVKRLCYQLIENHDDFAGSAIIGLQPRGIFLARRIRKALQEILKSDSILYGELDTTFYRDDFRRREIQSPSQTKIDFIIEGKKIILVDDVLLPVEPFAPVWMQ